MANNRYTANQQTGQTLQVIQVSGTIPVVFQGNTYNIPVAVWVPREFPTVPPVAYVVPTETMVVRPNKHVDAAGKIYHLYLNQWAFVRLVQC